MTFFNDMSYAPHVSSHSSFGGIYGCDVISDWVTMGLLPNISMQEKICATMNTKFLYRAGLINVDKNCSLENDETECNFQCRDSNTTLAAVEAFYDVTHEYYNPNTNMTLSEIFEVIEDFLCSSDGISRMYVGEHYEASSVTDPTFWVLHPTLERLFHARLLAGGFNDETWANDTVNDFVCLSSPCYDENTDTTDYFDSCCYGHFENDQMYDGWNGTRWSYIGATNAEAFSSVDPRTDDYSVDYIYDNFEWNHCSGGEYNINGLLDELYFEYAEVNELNDAKKFFQKAKKNRGKVKDKQIQLSSMDIRKEMKGMKRYVDKEERKQVAKQKIRSHEGKVIKRIEKLIESNTIRYEKMKQLESYRQT